MGEIVEGSPLLTAELELEQISFSKETVRLLIITDQKGSASLPTPEVAAAARAHFHSFISLLREFLRRSIKTYLVKNIGDSLMIHLECSPDDIPDVLSEILTAQNKISPPTLRSPLDDPSAPPKSAIRVGVFLIDDKYVVDGDTIASKEHDDLVASGVLPPNRPLPSEQWKNTWLSGDLFGPSIALAFRASQLSSSTLLTVGESVVEKLRGTGNDSDEFRWRDSDGKELFFGEALPFSPLKGFEDLFGVPERRAGWTGHFFLRAVTFSEDCGQAEKLALEQQKFRAWGRMIWKGVPSAPLVAFWNKTLRELAGSTSYLRTVSKVEDENHKSFPQPTNNSRQKKKAARNPRIYGRDLHPGTLPVGFVFAFASPNEQAFNIFRQRLVKEQARSRKGTDGPFVCAVSTICFSPLEDTGLESRDKTPEGLIEFWPLRLKEVDWFVLLLGRWCDQFRDNRADDFVKYLQAAVSPNTGLEVATSGRTIGGEWDVYVCLVPTANVAAESSSKLFSKFRKKLGQLPGAAVYATAAFVCDQQVFKSFAKERKTSAISPDNLSTAV